MNATELELSKLRRALSNIAHMMSEWDWDDTLLNAIDLELAFAGYDTGYVGEDEEVIKGD